MLAVWLVHRQNDHIVDNHCWQCCWGRYITVTMATRVTITNYFLCFRLDVLLVVDAGELEFSCGSPSNSWPWLYIVVLTLTLQVVDTPGILDHTLEERNTIEMQAITALAHLRAAVLYIMDVSEQCGYTLEQQVREAHWPGDSDSDTGQCQAHSSCFFTEILILLIKT